MSKDEDRFPADPKAHPQEAVDELEREAASGEGDDETDVEAEDVTHNPDSGDLEGLPGPSPGEPGESAG